ncbi:stress protein [Vitiosangium sp. GDMCC 1.1324]|nr:stress protein [Vitiosangium sp. GDMCC 1.1324]
MIINLLRFSFKEGVTEAEKRRALAAISRTAAVDSVSFSVIGQDLGDPTEGYTHSYCVGIPDLAALDRYLSEPVHREGDFVFAPVVAKLTRVALSDDTDPALSEKLMAIHARKMAADPEWANLLRAVPGMRING